jgi:predicted RNA-binding Zn-ribbon protein involved in translation (DUF1610 family)
MHHVRTFSGGAAIHDPRRKTYAVFHCDVCGEDEEVDITGRQDTFQFNTPRLCPHCKSMGKDDEVVSIKKEIEELTRTKNNIDIQLEQLTTKLEELTTTEKGI